MTNLRLIGAAVLALALAGSAQAYPEGNAVSKAGAHPSHSSSKNESTVDTQFHVWRDGFVESTRGRTITLRHSGGKYGIRK